MSLALTPARHEPGLRIDKFLWFARLASSRSAAQAMAQRGIMRLNGRRVERAHSPVRIGDLITLAQGSRIRVVRVVSLPHRRGPAPEARDCYEDLTLGDGVDLSGHDHIDAEAPGE